MEEDIKELAQLVVKLGVTDLLREYFQKESELLSPENIKYVRNRWTENPIKKSSLSKVNLQWIAGELGINLDDLDQDLLDEIHRQNMPDMPDDMVVQTLKDMNKNMLEVVLAHIKDLDLKLLKQDNYEYMKCLLDMNLVIMKTLIFSYTQEKYRNEINAILYTMEITSIDNEVDLLFEAFRQTPNIDETLSIINESEYLFRHSKSGLSTIEVPKTLEYKVDKYLNLFSYGKDYLKAKKELPVKIECKSVLKIAKPQLSIPQIAVIMALKQTHVNRDNADDLIAPYGYKSGAKLYNTFCMHNEPSKRISPPLNSSSVKKLQNKIELFESVVDHLDGKDRERLVSEIEMLRRHLNDFY